MPWGDDHHGYGQAKLRRRIEGALGARITTTHHPPPNIPITQSPNHPNTQSPSIQHRHNQRRHTHPTSSSFGDTERTQPPSQSGQILSTTRPFTSAAGTGCGTG